MVICLLTSSFNIARFEHENEVWRKALKPEKNELQLFLESGIRNPESTARNPESKNVVDSLTRGDTADTVMITQNATLSNA